MPDDFATRPWAVDPPPLFAATPLRVDWPRGGTDPFDVHDRRTQRLIVAAGFTRAWPASEEHDPADAVPMGYTMLTLLEKLAVVHRGRLVAEWPRSRGGPADLRMVFQRTTQPWFARDRRRLAAARAGVEPAGTAAGGGALMLPGAGGYAYTLDLALALSTPAGDEPLLVADLLHTVPWH